MTDEKILSVSWTRLRSWIECKQKAHLQHQGIKSPSQNLKIFHKGTTVDRILRDWLLEPHPQLGEMIGRVEEYMGLVENEYEEQESGVVRWSHATERTETIAWCKKLITKLEPIMEELVLPYKYVPDVRFRTPLFVPDLQGEPRQVDLIGAMDIQVIEGLQLYSVYDLKATENDAYWKKTIMQLVFYAMAIESMYGVMPIKTALIQPMCAQPVMPLDISEEHVLMLVDKITQYAHSVWMEDFSPKDSDAGCDWCSVRHACVKFAKDKKSKRVSFS